MYEKMKCKMKFNSINIIMLATIMITTINSQCIDNRQHNNVRSKNNNSSSSSSSNDCTNNKTLSYHELPQMQQQLGVCQMYIGTTCDQYLRNQTVFVPPHITIDILEERLKAAYGVIKESKDMNPNCRVYALPSLCYSILPICRTPEKTNHLYFANKAATEHYAKKQAAAAAAAAASAITQAAAAKRRATNIDKRRLSITTTTTTTTTTTATTTTTIITIDNDNANIDNDDDDDDDDDDDGNSLNIINKQRLKRSSSSQTTFLSASAAAAFKQTEYPPTRSSENLRRICRNECELLENELCQKEYAIAKRHPTIGQKLPLEDCYDLPENDDCSKMGIVIDADETEQCFWENGSGYRGTQSKSITGKTCLKWARLMKEIANYPELAGQNYCRNPGSTQNGPWCFVDRSSTDKSTDVHDYVREMCNIDKCSDKMWLYIIITFIIIGILIMTIITIFCCKKYRKRGMTNIQNINLPMVDKNIYGNSRLNSPIEMTSLLSTANNQNNLLTTGNSIMNNSHAGGGASGGGRNGNNSGATGGGGGGRNNIIRIQQYTLNDVKFVEELGEGAFGKVYKGELQQINGEKIFVAVKALKENASAKTQSDFKREIELISDLKHDNIVCILGVVLKEEPLCMLFEYMTKGDLHEYLISQSPNEGKSLTQLQFLHISMQICEGMDYLSGHHYVHRDLAARNCLVGESLTVKISDFGLSRDIYSSDYYRVQSKSLLPVRWMPSESILYGKFTTESDVWSFGVVLWEIYSYGLQPYYGYSNQEVISMVRARQLLPCPEACPSAVYSLMIECWHEQAVRRPSFPEIGHRLKIWYQAQKRCDQAENSSNCPSRKGSTFSVSNRHSNSITPSTSNHHITQQNTTTIMGTTGVGGSGSISSGGVNTIGRVRDPSQPTTTSSLSSTTSIDGRDRDDRSERIIFTNGAGDNGSSSGGGHNRQQNHHHHHHHSQQQHHQQQQHSYRSSHNSLDRSSGNNLMNSLSSSSSSTRKPSSSSSSTVSSATVIPITNNNQHSHFNVTKSRSSNSNSSLSLTNNFNLSEEQLNLQHHQHLSHHGSRKSNIDIGGNNVGDVTEQMCISAIASASNIRSNNRQLQSASSAASSTGNSIAVAMMRPPKDLKVHQSSGGSGSSNSGGDIGGGHHMHHHHHHHHHHNHQHRKKSFCDDKNNVTRKISGAGSVTSILSDSSMSSFTNHSITGESIILRKEQ